MLGAPVNKKGSVIVDRFLNPPGMPNVFVCGDLADVTENGRQIPGVAQPAMQMGTQAAHMIQADLDGRPRKHFHYFDKGDMATIGRNRAVADVKWPFKAHWGGFLAWASWLVVHIYFLIGFRNRILVLIQWGWAYLAQGHGARLIMGNQSLPGWDRLVPERPTASDRPLDLASPAVSDPVSESPSQRPAQIGNPAGAAHEKVTA
jgi:NADH dehydrogenase